VGAALQPGGVVINESTVYPGATQEVCVPELERHSGLTREQYQLAYSPERINPGDHEHTLERVIKVVAADDEPTLERVARLYGAIVEAGIHRAPSIRVAEAAKVLENTQRDLNIALMNEMAILFDRLGIATRDVLAAAGTKWNFLHFTPGLVGGHCIGVDPYYLTHKAEQVGYHPEVILAGRRINDGMGRWVAARLVRELARMGRHVLGARVGVLGLAYKPDVADSRSSRVPDIVRELQDFGVAPLVHDPLVDRAEVESHYGIRLVELDALQELDALLIAVPHRWYAEFGWAELFGRLRGDGVVFDVKSVLDRGMVPGGVRYLSL
ncbi:MAG: nucleotide sugar dehydrogenase, partial [Deltaproteobacteria bacterium]|nr:nucleotide sugar dehydrogenase [Deltaproteobacteria bacterium]